MRMIRSQLPRSAIAVWACPLFVVLTVAAAGAPAEFPLKTVRLTSQEAWQSPGRSGGFIYAVRPEAIHHEPSATSSRPLYGTVRGGLTFRLDESKGTGKGYDRLLLDLDRDGDLADEDLHFSVKGATPRRSAPTRALFGPIDAPLAATAESVRPGLYAQMTLYDPKRLAGPEFRPDSMVGHLLLKPSFYLTTTFEVEGVRQRIALFDGDCNFHLGDCLKLPMTAEIDPEEWDLQPADYLVRDRDGSGRFERKPTWEGAEFLGTPTYFGGQPFVLSVNKAMTTLRLEPYAEPLGTLIPTSERPLRSLTLLQADGTGQGEVLTPGLLDGKVQVPVGTYRLLSCVLAAQVGDGVWTMVVSRRTAEGETVSVEAGSTSQLRCGVPLILTVQATNVEPEALWGLSVLPTKPRPAEVHLKARVTGAGGELYAGFRQGKNLNHMKGMGPPRFEVIDPRGWRIGRGTLARQEQGAYTGSWKVPAWYAGHDVAFRAEFDLGALDSLKSEPIAVQLQE